MQIDNKITMNGQKQTNEKIPWLYVATQTDQTNISNLEYCF